MNSDFMLSFCFVCKTMWFYLKMVCKEKKNAKCQPKKIACEIVNFGLTKLTKPTKNF